MTRRDPIAAAPDAWDRRRSAAFVECLTVVRNAMLRANAEDPDAADWSNALGALDTLRRSGLATGDPAALAHPPEHDLDARGSLTFVAIVSLDHFSGLPEAAVARLAHKLCIRIARFIEGSAFGRVSRSSVELIFKSPDLCTAEQMMRALQQELETSVEVDDQTIHLGVTIGLAGRCGAEDDLDIMVDRAEQALAKARASHAKVSAYTERDQEERSVRSALLRDLRRANRLDELFVCYQPKMALKTSTIDAVEALIRWRHPARGLVPPTEFIGVAEESGEIRPLTEFVIRQAVADHDRLRRLGYDLLMNINISGCLLADEAFAASVIVLTEGRTTGLGFEITETAVIADPDRALRNIRAFAAAGIKISIDDYGSGLSSLTYLKQIPAHELKIDREFIKCLTSSHRDPLLVRSTIDLAHALEMVVTAEGVDSARTLSLLGVMGCDMIQGYHLSKPLELADLVVFLKGFDARAYRQAPRLTAAR